jgi:oligoendopeptidase F
MTITPTITPYVLLNYTNKMRDVSTLAHELGHGVHSLYANKHSISTQHATLPLAETASTLGEMILFEKILSETKDPKLKKQLLSDKLADSYATVCRQNYIVKFEISAHDAIQKGIEENELSQMWLDNLKQQFGDSVEVDEMFRYEWAYIPHIIHTPFYCYAYNFGELLSMALYAKYKQEGESFVPKIEAILAAGGSQDPKEVLANVGIDMSSADFWQGSFELIRAWQKELETL